MIVMFILTINKIFDVSTLCCCKNKVLTWYRWSCKKINGYDNIYNKLLSNSNSGEIFLTIIIGCARMIIFFCCDESQNNKNDDNIITIIFRIDNMFIHIIISTNWKHIQTTIWMLIFNFKIHNYFFFFINVIGINNMHDNRMIFIIKWWKGRKCTKICVMLVLCIWERSGNLRNDKCAMETNFNLFLAFCFVFFCCQCSWMLCLRRIFFLFLCFESFCCAVV